MEEELANLRILDEEEEAFQEEAAMVDRSYQFYLVGQCLTDSVVHFPYLRNTMADLWHPIRGICITDLGDKRYLFQFFHEVDMQRMLSSTPWFFNNHFLILQTIQKGENPPAILLNFTKFWVQIHDLPPGLMIRTMAKQFGEFLGKFLEYDTFIPTLGLKRFMRIRIHLDVSTSLKRKKKDLDWKRNLGHGESYCPFRLRIEPANIVFGWDISLRTVVWRRSTLASRWLRQADGSQWNNENIEAVQCQFHGRINELEKANGARISTTEEMLKLASNFFGNLFSASDMGSNGARISTTDMNDFLLQQFTEEDIAYAVKMMAQLKAPGIENFI
ncbi:hypothetical protein GOBAR_AA04642 [Gossypium barbadense]|uniref:DUF4283 domain-containing protein n=1 Tax=Gossypium barbadense TaxID=3634 RepID=A0A2P5YK25_GOSBA|nr:hypothetical protein GOBAR_AA04642 [Gossypium barbadense]